MKENKRKSFFGMNSKSYTRQSKDKRRNSLPNEGRSNSYLISQGANKLKLLNNNEKTPKANINITLNKNKENNNKGFSFLKYIKKINMNNDNN